MPSAERLSSKFHSCLRSLASRPTVHFSDNLLVSLIIHYYIIYMYICICIYIYIYIYIYNSKSLKPVTYIFNFQVETHSFQFAIDVSNDQHVCPSSVANTNEPLVGVI